MEIDKFHILLVLGVILLTSGCTADQTPESTSDDISPDSPEYSLSDTQSSDSGDTIRKSINQSENTTLTVIANNDEDTFTMNWKVQRQYKDNFTGFGFGNGLNMTANVQCNVIQQTAYNNTAFQNSIEELNRSINELNNESTEGNQSKESSRDDGYWDRVYREYEVEEVKGVFYNEDGSEKLAECNPTKEDLNLRILSDEYN
jgi:hypothetical protein